jgi:hypothetical protein
MLLFLSGIAVMASYACRNGPPEPHGWWPLIVIGFAGGGLFGLIHALKQEVAVVEVRGPGGIAIQRGKAFRREERWTDRTCLWIKDTKDNEGANRFDVWMEAPGGPLRIAQGPRRKRLIALQQRLESAVSGD